MVRVFIIHGWEGSPDEGWFPWLKKKLEEKGIEVFVPSMPNPEEPDIDAWVGLLRDTVGEINEETYFIGHSIGCQAIMRYLAETEGKIGGIIFVAGWFHLTPEVTEEEGAEEIAKPWLEKPIDVDKIKEKTTHIVAVFSDNDPYVPLDDAKIFEARLEAKIIMEKGKGHIGGEHNITELPVVFDEIVKMV